MYNNSSNNNTNIKEENKQKSEFIKFVKGLKIDDMTDEKLEKFGEKHDTLIQMARQENADGIMVYAAKKVGFVGANYEFERHKIATQLMDKYISNAYGRSICTCLVLCM